MSKKKKNIKEIFFAIISPIAIAGAGYIVGSSVGSNIGERFPNDLGIIEILFGIIILMTGFIVQLILHELGHLIFGLLSGYEFVSFRVGSLTLIKEDNKFSIKKFTIQGTGGQCLMMPKANDYEKCSYALYNLGGVLMNALSTFLCFIIYSLVKINPYIDLFLQCMIIFGIVDILTNAIPMKIGGISNDGHNLMSIKRDNLTKYCFYTQLKVHGLLSQGVRIKDMPLKWFELNEDVNFSDTSICGIKCSEASYYHDRLEFDKAKECYEFLLNYSPKILKLFQNEIKCELLFYEIIGNQDKDKINELYTKKLKSYIKATSSYISRARLMYAYYLIIEKDIKKSNNMLKKIEKLKNTYPIKGDLLGELEIIEFIKDKFSIDEKTSIDNLGS